MTTPPPPPLPTGARMVDLYGPSGAWLLSTPVADDQAAADQLARVKARVALPGALALVQVGPDVVHRELRAPDGWRVVTP